MLKDTTKLLSMANAIRMLSAEAVNKAKGGHLGTPLGAADVVTALFTNFMKFNPQDPTWINRDRFILSAGHACIMQYSVLHLLGYKKFTLESLKNLRQLNSITSGHPEIDHTAGIEVTTGPLGQGIAMAVGIALAERVLNNKYSQLINYKTYVLVGDGCLMEGVSYEALAVAAKLNLNNLIIIYDKNNITIDGALDLSSSEDVKLRMQALGFNILEIDGHNFNEISTALDKAVNDYSQNSQKPTFIISNSKIGYGAKGKEGKASAHGGALTPEELISLKENLNWHYEPFVIPQHIKDLWNKVSETNTKFAQTWESKLNSSSQKQALLGFVNKKFDANKINNELEKLGQEYINTAPKISTRVASGKILEMLVENIPFLIGGSADLSSSNNTKNKNSVYINSRYEGNYIPFGVREHAMAAISNGIAASGNGFIPFTGTFLVFSDYMRPAIRLSALMEQQVIYIFTHDNISLGGDGPTHQPVEHLLSLHAMPNLEVLRPCDIIEAIECYQIALTSYKTPVALILGRDNVPTLRKSYSLSENQSALGGYVIKNNNIQNAQINLISSGSELFIAYEAAEILEKEGINSKVISVPSFNRFLNSSADYKKSVLGNAVNLVIGAYNLLGWKDILGSNTFYHGMTSFGKSGEGQDVMNYFGFNTKEIVKKAQSIIQG